MRASARNLWRVLVLFTGVLAFLFGATQEVVLAIPHARGAVVIGVFVILGAGVVWINLTLTRDCKLFGALCPRCGRQLIGPGHTVSTWRKFEGRMLGQCPSCFVHLEETASDGAPGE